MHGADGKRGGGPYLRPRVDSTSRSRQAARCGVRVPPPTPACGAATLCPTQRFVTAADNAARWRRIHVLAQTNAAWNGSRTRLAQLRGGPELDRHQPIAIVITSFLFACAAAPTAQLGESEAAYRAAQEVGAANQPDAAYHLKLAEDQIAAAKKLMDGNKKEKRQARKLLEQAELDAEVAISHAKTHQAQARAKQAWEKVNELKIQNATQGE